MKYRIAYQCRTDGKTFDSDIEVECEYEPQKTDCQLIERVLSDTRKFHLSGIGGVEIISIDKT